MTSYMQFSPEVYAQRRSELMERLRSTGYANDLILLLAHPQPFGSNEDHPVSDFQTTDLSDSNFLYYVGPSGIAASNCAAVVMNVKTGITKLFSIPDMPTGKDLLKQQIWNGGDALDPQIIAKKLWLIYGWSIKDFSHIDERNHFDAVLNYMPIIASDQLLYYGKKFAPFNMTSLEEWSSDRFRQLVADQRLEKSEEEIKLMVEEWDVTTEIHNLVIKLVRDGTLTSEQAVYGFIVGQIAWRGKLPSFPPIVTTRGDILHNRNTSKRLFQEGDLVLIDFGTKDPISGVCADQTSTIPISREFSSAQAQIYTIVYNTHRLCMDACTLGTSFGDVHKLAAITITQGLLDLWLLHGASAEELVEKWVHKLFFPHGLGHAIGLDTHDLWDQNEDVVGWSDVQRDKENNPLHNVRFNRVLDIWHCFTIEPGIYFIPGLIEEWKREKKFADYINWTKVDAYATQVSGIRYEECYYISHEGCKKLGTKDKPARIDEIQYVGQ